MQTCRAIVSIVVVILIICCAFAGFIYTARFLFTSPSEQLLWRAETRLNVAQKRWEMQAITDYQFIYSPLLFGQFNEHGCTVTVTVQNSVGTVTGHTCKYSRFTDEPPLTIDEMFVQIDMTLSERNCGPNGCQCNGHIFINADYDATYGYPKRAVSDMTNMTTTPYVTIFTEIFRICTAVGFIGGDGFEIVQFQVLP